jgi:xanthine/uracil/vitamin C permease (AzgA family)
LNNHCDGAKTDSLRLLAGEADVSAYLAARRRGPPTASSFSPGALATLAARGELPVKQLPMVFLIVLGLIVLVLLGARNVSGIMVAALVVLTSLAGK